MFPFAFRHSRKNVVVTASDAALRLLVEECAAGKCWLALFTSSPLHLLPPGVPHLTFSNNSITNNSTAAAAATSKTINFEILIPRLVTGMNCQHSWLRVPLEGGGLVRERCDCFLKGTALAPYNNLEYGPGHDQNCLPVSTHLDTCWTLTHLHCSPSFAVPSPRGEKKSQARGLNRLLLATIGND